MQKTKTSLRLAVVWLFAMMCAVFSVSSLADIPNDPITTGWMGDPNHPYIQSRFILTGRYNEHDKTVAGYIEVQLSDDWKTYWRSPGEGGIAPSMNWENSENINDIEWFWTYPQRFDLLGINTLGYKHKAIFPLKLHVEDMNKPVVFDAVLTMSSCTTICILSDLPMNLEFVPSELVPADGAAFEFAQTMSKVPRPSALISDVEAIWDQNKSQLQVNANHSLGWKSPDVIVDGESIEMQDANFSLPEINLEDGKITATFDVSSWMGTPDLTDENIFISFQDGEFVAEHPVKVKTGMVVTGKSSMVSMLLFALLGGLILNVMPCVFPVLGMKLSSIVMAQGMEKKQIRLQFLASASGIMTSFWLIAAFLAFLKLSGNAIGWGIQFQSGWFIGLMFLITTLFGANMLGLFEIRLSSNTNTWMASKGDSSYVGHFTQGMFATLLATPCSAPFLGTAVAFALATNIPTMFGIFTALAVGMALPWILVAMFPSIALALPKPGAWMNRVKYVFGGMMLLTSMWLMSLLSNHIADAWMISLVSLAACLLLGRMAQVHGIKASIALGLLLISVVGSAVMFEKSSTKLLPQEPQWEELSTDAITEYVQDGKVVFVDVTADWCVTCKANKIGVLLQEPVYSALTEPDSDIVVMQGDWSVPSERVTSFLQGFGRYGVPFNIVYGPAAPNGIELPVILTSEKVMQAIDQARGK